MKQTSKQQTKKQTNEETKRQTNQQNAVGQTNWQTDGRTADWAQQRNREKWTGREKCRPTRKAGEEPDTDRQAASSESHSRLGPTLPMHCLSTVQTLNSLRDIMVAGSAALRANFVTTSQGLVYYSSLTHTTVAMAMLHGGSRGDIYLEWKRLGKGEGDWSNLSVSTEVTYWVDQNMTFYPFTPKFKKYILPIF